MDEFDFSIDQALHPIESDSSILLIRIALLLQQQYHLLHSTTIPITSASTPPADYLQLIAILHPNGRQCPPIVQVLKEEFCKQPEQQQQSISISSSPESSLIEVPTRYLTKEKEIAILTSPEVGLSIDLANYYSSIMRGTPAAYTFFLSPSLSRLFHKFKQTVKQQPSKESLDICISETIQYFSKLKRVILSKSDAETRKVLESLAYLEDDNEGIDLIQNSNNSISNEKEDSSKAVELIEKVKRTMFAYEKDGKLYMSPVVRRGLRDGVLMNCII